VSLDLIAAEAGVSRMTLFNQFGNKRALLEATIKENQLELLVPILDHPEGGLRERLTAYASQYDKMALSVDGINFSKFVGAGLAKFPDISLMVYKTGLKIVLSALGKYFADQIDGGNIRAIDPDLTAELFIGALGGTLRQRVYAGLPIDAPKRRKARIEETVDMFVRALQR
jgi:TetR/AcrR family transcriptional repressor of mexJK operon